jgi:CubicO group peptidase (beta-lactamase class C family)
LHMRLAAGPARDLLLTLTLLAASATADVAAAPTVMKEARAVLFDRDPESHRRAADSLLRLGYHPLSLDAYGDATETRFASAWVRSTKRGAAKSAARSATLLRNDVPAAAFRDSLAAWSAHGLRPALIAAHPDGASLAVALRADSLPGWAAVDLDEEGLRRACDSAQRAGYRPAWVDARGEPGKARYAAAFARNAGGVPWNYSLGDDARSFEEKSAVFAPTWVRPALVVSAPGGRLFTLWEEGAIGPWTLHASVPSAEIADTLRALEARGLHPLTLTASDTAFTVLAAARSAPLPKAWTVAGPASPGLEAFDRYMRRLMQAHGVRAGSLAMVKDGRLVLARGYTWAEEGYPLTAPSSLFRVASCSKPLTSMAVHRLLREGGDAEAPLSLKEKVISLIRPGYGAGAANPAVPASPVDARFADITVDDLLAHSAGWVRSKENPDPIFNDWPAGSPIRRRLPALAKDFLAYMLGQPLQYAPGASSSYANFGYFLLGRILETSPHGLGRGYEEAMGDLLFRPLGLNRPRFGGTLLAERRPGEVLYHTRYPYLQKSRAPEGGPWVPGAYGDFDLRNMDAAGAWILSAPDYAKVLASFDLEGRNPVLPPEAVRTMWAPPHDPRFLRGWFATRLKPRSGGQSGGDSAVAKWHNGLFPGTSALVYYRPDKWSFALFLNRDLSPQLTGDKQGRELGGLADAVTAWPERDLFPAMGIDSFEAEEWAGGPEKGSERQHYITASP